MTVSESWDRIEAWFARHHIAELLHPPASDAAIEAAQAEVGLRFPADLVESLRRHDGVHWTAALVPYSWVLRPLDRVVAEWRERTDDLAARQEAEIDDMSDEDDDDWTEVEDGEEDDFWGWNPAWLPIAADGSGCTLIVELRPGPVFGVVGNLDPESPPAFGDYHRRPSVAAVLRSAADALDGIGTEYTPVPHERGLHWVRPSRFELGGT